jgi:undecaprenyl diphosphate synthase
MTIDSHTPACVGFIMDGNRRWAKEQGLPTFEGHRRGAEVFSDCVRWVRDAGIAHAVFYAFSTENWQRSKEEVSYLMDLFRELLQKIDKQIATENVANQEKKVKLRIVGRREDFSADLQAHMSEIETKSESYEDATTTIWMALSYGGRAEIVGAVNEAIARGEEVTEDSFEQLLWTADMPDPDLIIRTSGEQRLSGFVTWKSVYSELFFLDAYWPAFTQAAFHSIVEAYADRQRRRGK